MRQLLLFPDHFHNIKYLYLFLGHTWEIDTNVEIIDVKLLAPNQ